MFVELLETANLTSLLEDTNRSLTVLVPKNDVFTEVKEYFDELTTKGNENKLENIIKMHIIDGKRIVIIVGWRSEIKIFVNEFQMLCAVLVLYNPNGHSFVLSKQSMTSI